MYLKRSRSYYYCDRGKWTYLGVSYVKALAKYHALEAARTSVGEGVPFWELCWQYDSRSLLEEDLLRQVRERRSLYALVSGFNGQQLGLISDKDLELYFQTRCRVLEERRLS